MKVETIISVIGAGQCDGSIARLAEQVGYEIAKRGAAMVCGGLGGVMEAACRGAQRAGGFTIGILPGEDVRTANSYVDLAIPSGLGEARNLLVVRSGQAVIAIAGEYGTLSEIAFALKMGRPVIGLDTWELYKKGRQDEAIIYASSPVEAVEMALNAIRRGVKR